MTREEFKQLSADRPLILDGATGSNLRAAGMPVGVSTECWVLDNPKVFQDLQREYVEAGSQVIYAPTFSANRCGLDLFSRADDIRDINLRLVEISQCAAQGRAFVAGDMAPTGKRAEEVGYDTLIDIYREQAGFLLEAGVDLFVVETMLSVTECSAAVEAIRSLCDLPVMCSMSLDSIGGAYFDGDADTAVQQLPALGADAFGVNCGQGPSLYEGLMTRLNAVSEVPLIAKPNAGLPEMQPDGRAVYSMSPGKFAREMLKLRSAGARILGGCCGTTPAHIRMLTEMLAAQA